MIGYMFEPNAEVVLDSVASVLYFLPGLSDDPRRARV